MLIKMTVHLYFSTGGEYWVKVGSGGGQDMGGYMQYLCHTVEMLGN